MSTAGKVLSVLVGLLAVVWIILSAGVTEINRSGALAVNKLQGETKKLQEDYAGLKFNLQGAKDGTDQQQIITQKELGTLKATQSDLEKVRASVLEVAARFNSQVAGAEANLKAAQNLSQEREEELVAEKKAKADAEALVAKLKGENDELLAELASQREKFKTTLAENRALVDRSERSRSSALPASTRPASFSR